MKFNNKQKIILAVGGIGLFMWYSKKEQKCPGNEQTFTVGGALTCENKLNGLGYFLYNPGVDNRTAGYYSIDAWDTGFNLPISAQTQWIAAATSHVINKTPGSQMWNQSVKLLDDSFVEGSQPLIGV